ncbi:MAG: hypothetical protein HZA48_06095 [Planctomycetes bacterium]|nr:hypothetical protein [Planctomycetota bacterium]
MEIFIFAIIFAVIILIAVYAYYASEQRRKDMVAAAGRLGLSYLQESADINDDTYGEIGLFQRGSSREAEHMLGGSKDGCNVDLFDYQYTTGSDKDKTTHNYSVCVLTVAQVFKPLFIRTESFLDRIAGAVGFDDIDFESKEFSNKYYVKSGDRKFAYDVIHPQMIEFLLGIGAIPEIEISGRHMAFYFNEIIKPEEYVPLCEFSLQFYKLIPHYLKSEM